MNYNFSNRKINFLVYWALTCGISLQPRMEKDNLLENKTIESPWGNITWLKSQINWLDEYKMFPQLLLLCIVLYYFGEGENKYSFFHGAKPAVLASVLPTGESHHCLPLLSLYAKKSVAPREPQSHKVRSVCKIPAKVHHLFSWLSFSPTHPAASEVCGIFS